ncbi:uncharacterized protein E0L32_000888 [Thyridium curvatum]|uniref:Zn(2)-C6 fungal-type domain-containing protein n=1 Tax=Thyridium curvatum TaxID=1093900 RepID=A0A507B6Q1_9PEZI|nr:uncharacterized protein E0L32_000888 [Thyridium curvatum]TPX12711.1 hypothetical protein E0L32_000888 [Thyridium curvatum]
MTNPQFSFRDTSFTGPSLLLDRREKVRLVTVKAQLKQLRDTGRYDCFKLEWHPVYDKVYLWPVPKSLFWDSDIAKWIEGACYFLAQHYDQEVDTAVRDLVNDIRSAQQEDGYLNVYFTVVEPNARWSNIRDQHELYNAGHLIEAALAHREYYRNDLLLEPIEKYVKLLSTLFGPGENQRHAYPGHPEIELALLRLYKATGNEPAYELARYFLEERGNPHGQEGMHYYDWEERQRGDHHHLRPNPYPEAGSHWYNQAHVPILEQPSVEGHSVRAMYLLTAVADLLCIDRQAPTSRSLERRLDWSKALDRLWNNMVDRKMSVTGGIGAIKHWEGFGIAYFLPQGTDEGGCYNETCAAIGVIMLAERLLELDLNSKYADIMELCLYNAVMTATNLQGTAFTYVNQLASSEKDKSERYDWFECACCPPNLMRLFGSLGGYLWDYGGANGQAFVNVHLYTSAKVSFLVDNESSVILEQTSSWPWKGKVQIELQASPSLATTLRLRIPGWAKNQFSVRMLADFPCLLKAMADNGKIQLHPPCTTAKVEKGYVILKPSYTEKHPLFTLEVGGFEPRFVAPHPYTNQNTISAARGPLIYCVEDCDNDWVQDHFKNTFISPNARLTEENCVMGNPEHSYVALHSSVHERGLSSWESQPQGSDPARDVNETKLALGDPRKIVFVPYYLRSNRKGKGHMRRCRLKALDCVYPVEESTQRRPRQTMVDMEDAPSVPADMPDATPYLEMPGSIMAIEQQTSVYDGTADGFDTSAQAFASGMGDDGGFELPINWLHTDYDMDVDYNSLFGLGLGNNQLDTAQISSLDNGLGGSSGGAPVFSQPFATSVQQYPYRIPQQEGSQSTLGLASPIPQTVQTAASPLTETSTPGSASSLTGTTSTASRLSAESHSPHLLARGGIYATSTNGSRIPCTARRKRKSIRVLGSTPLKPVSTKAEGFSAEDNLDIRMRFPDLSSISCPPVENDAYSRTVESRVYDHIVSQFKLLCLSNHGLYAPYAADNFPDLDFFKFFVHLYFENFDPILPIYHDRVTNLNEHWVLALAIATIGSQYTETQQFSQCVIPLHEFLRRAVATELERQDGSPVSVTLLQATILSQVGMLYQGSARLRRLAKSRRSLFVDALESLSSSGVDQLKDMCATRDVSEQSLEGLWSQWLFEETTRRLCYAIWLLDCMAAYHFELQPLLALESAQWELPHDELWGAQDIVVFRQKSRSSTKRQMKPDLGEYSNLLLLHGVYQELFKVKSYFDRGLSGWVPSIPQLGHLNPAVANGGSASDRERQNTLASWRSAAMDCVDVLHWAANGVVAQLLGAEHATVFHLHFSRVVLFSPYSKIRALASGLASLAETPQGSPLTQREATLKLESEVLEWAQRDEHKARLAALHCGCFFWHVRRYSCNAFYEPTSVFLATLVLWAYSSYASRAPLPSRTSNSESSAEDPPDPTFIHLDRPCDDEMVQLFVRSGRPSVIRAYVAGVGDIYDAKGPLGILQEGRKLLVSMSTAWGRTTDANARIRLLLAGSTLGVDTGVEHKRGQMSDVNRALAACLRCRRQKLKCGGPAEIPCRRCRASGAECVFAAPKASSAKDAIDRSAGGSYDATQHLIFYSRSYEQNCKETIEFLDEQIIPPKTEARKYPLLALVICAIAARAIKPERYQFFIGQSDNLIKDYFNGPAPDKLSLVAMMLLAAWTGRIRLWGFISSVAIELKLNESALQLGDRTIEQTEDMVERGRLWYTICCFDLTINVTRPFFTNRMKEYLPQASELLLSPYRRPVDYHIYAYVQGFTITGDAKGQIKMSRLMAQPLPDKVAETLMGLDQRADIWFQEMNTGTDPHFQPLDDRSQRFTIPYAFIKLYINGLALNGFKADKNPMDSMRIGFVKRAVDNACLLIQTQFESESFRRGIRYTMDYNGMTLYYASTFIFKAMNLIHHYLDCEKSLLALLQAAQIFEEAGASETATEMRREQGRLASATNTTLPPLDVPDLVLGDAQLDSFFDIPSFLDDMLDIDHEQ